MRIYTLLFAYGTYPDIEGLIREQATELDRAKRETILHRIQQLMHETVMFAPLMEPAIIAGYGRGWPSRPSDSSPT